MSGPSAANDRSWSDSEGRTDGTARSYVEREDGIGRATALYRQAMIEITDGDRIRTIQLQRPEAKNAMNEALWDAAAQALFDAAADPAIAVVIFTGSGDSFSAGQDVIEMAEATMAYSFTRTSTPP